MSRPDADRNLLFGILALQMDLITRDALIAAMATWATAKHRTLGEILVEAGALDPSDRANLEPMIDRRIDRHGGDPARTLVALSSAGSVAEDLRRSITDPDVLASIDQIETNPESDPDATRAPEPEPPHPPGVRFRKLREHAAGNLGVVYVARDEELNRDVALKEIRERNADHPYNQAKFLLEAEVTGGLEHPGIVPVYGLGHHLDGRPFYAMRFIRGKSLLDAIKRFHADESLRNDPGQRLLELQKLLRRFTDVCNAIAYAHSRGVLHRDLKPDNVMVGKYGETLVVDWGLAKALGTSGLPGTVFDADDPLPEGSLLPSKSDHLEVTQAGKFVGTPAYASPEQAAGRLDLLGPASDIYGLGATLYHLIVGRTPVNANSLPELLVKIQAGEITRPRAIASWVDPALEAICLKAMALKPSDRYETPRALAEDLDRWIVDQPVTAYREPWTRRARRWSRRNRTLVSTLSASLLVAAVLAGLVGAALRDRRMKTDASASKILNGVDRLKVSEAIAEVRRAETLLETGGGSPDLKAAVRARLDELMALEKRELEDVLIQKRDREMEKTLFEARLGKALVKKGDQPGAGTIQDSYLNAFRGYGIDLASLASEAAAALIRKSGISDQLIAAIDEWADENPKNVDRARLDAILASADWDEDRKQMRAAIASQDSKVFRRLIEDEAYRRKNATQLYLVENALGRFDLPAKLQLLEAARRDHPGDFWFNHDLASAYMDSRAPRYDLAVRYYTAAAALKPDSAGVRTNLGNALNSSGDPEGAMLAYREAIAINPDFFMPHNNLGILLYLKGDIPGSIAEFREAIRLKPDFAAAYNNLGNVLYKSNDLEGALAAFRETLRLDPKTPGVQNNIAMILRARTSLDESLAASREAIRLRPNDAQAYNQMGAVLHEKKEFDAALAACREALRLRPGYVDALVNIGVILRDQKDEDGSIASFLEAIRLEPGNFEAHCNLGFVQTSRNELDAAIASLGKAIELKPDHEEAFTRLGLAYQKKGDFAGAIKAVRESDRLKPNVAATHSNLGALAQMAGQLDEAITEYRRAIELQPDFAEAHANLGIALRKKDDLDGAIASYREAIKLRPSFPDPYLNLGIALIRKGEMAEAIASLRESIRLEPKSIAAHSNLAYAYVSQKNIPEAIKEYREAVRLNPNLAQDHYNLASLLHNSGDLAGAIAEFREAIRCDPNFAEGHGNLGKALKEAGDNTQAIAEFRETIRLKPELADAYITLGMALSDQGDFEEALKQIERGHELGSKRPNWNFPFAQYAAEIRKFIEIEAKYPAILKGEVELTTAEERLVVALLAQKKKRPPAISARFFDEAFAAKPALTENPTNNLRYNAACAAALTGAGLGREDPPFDEPTRTRWREKARDWLKADLAIWEKVLETKNPQAPPFIVRTLTHWKQDPDFTGIRDEAALAKLPEAERDALRTLWADVEALRIKAGGK